MLQEWRLPMVTFKKDSFVVEVKTHGDPIEDWLKTINEMIDVLQAEDEQMSERRYRYLELMKELMPDWETAKKMTVNTAEISKQ